MRKFAAVHLHALPADPPIIPQHSKIIAIRHSRGTLVNREGNLQGYIRKPQDSGFARPHFIAGCRNRLLAQDAFLCSNITWKIP